VNVAPDGLAVLVQVLHICGLHEQECNVLSLVAGSSCRHKLARYHNTHKHSWNS